MDYTYPYRNIYHNHTRKYNKKTSKIIKQRIMNELPEWVDYEEIPTESPDRKHKEENTQFNSYEPFFDDNKLKDVGIFNHNEILKGCRVEKVHGHLNQDEKWNGYNVWAHKKLRTQNEVPFVWSNGETLNDDGIWKHYGIHENTSIWNEEGLYNNGKFTPDSTWNRILDRNTNIDPKKLKRAMLLASKYFSSYAHSVTSVELEEYLKDNPDVDVKWVDRLVKFDDEVSETKVDDETAYFTGEEELESDMSIDEYVDSSDELPKPTAVSSKLMDKNEYYEKLDNSKNI